LLTRFNNNIFLRLDIKRQTPNFVCTVPQISQWYQYKLFCAHLGQPGAVVVLRDVIDL